MQQEDDVDILQKLGLPEQIVRGKHIDEIKFLAEAADPGKLVGLCLVAGDNQRALGREVRKVPSVCTQRPYRGEEQLPGEDAQKRQ